MFAWVRLVNDVWWPGVIADTEASTLCMHMPNLRIMKLNGKVDSNIPIDISHKDSVHLCAQTEIMSAKEDFFVLHQDQVLPEDLCFNQSIFSLAIKELGVQLGLKTEETETPQQLVKATKRTSAIPWDNYFMAVAFLSAYVMCACIHGCDIH